MTQIGRNDPCPCGSGRKFKKCCLNKSGAAPVSYTSADRDGAIAKLTLFSGRQEFVKRHSAAFELFWGDWLLEELGEDLERVMDSDTVNLAYHSWFIFDFGYGELPTMLDTFLEEAGSGLSSGERQYLEGMRDSHLRLYEILEVKADEGFQLRDLWDDKILWVRERSATRQLVAWDLIVGRIGPSGGVDIVFETLPYVFPATAKDNLLSGLRKAHRVFTKQFGGGDIVHFFKRMAPIFHQLWLNEVALRPLPKVFTRDGEPFVFAKVIFDLLDRHAATASLSDRENIVDDGGGSYSWLEPAAAFQRTFGTIILEKQRLVFETTSKKRAEKGRDELSKMLGDAVRLRAISYEDVGQAIKHAGGKKKEPEAPHIPVEVQRKVLGEFYDQHYRKWLDEPVPALGNRTPRHAAKLKTVRPRLIALLKDFESHSERQRRAGEVAYDFGWMWKELGLIRK